jgi:hypothetical protein
MDVAGRIGNDDGPNRSRSQSQKDSKQFPRRIIEDGSPADRRKSEHRADGVRRRKHGRALAGAQHRLRHQRFPHTATEQDRDGRECGPFGTHVM